MFLAMMIDLIRLRGFLYVEMCLPSRGRVPCDFYSCPGRELTLMYRTQAKSISFWSRTIHTMETLLWISHHSYEYLYPSRHKVAHLFTSLTVKNRSPGYSITLTLASRARSKQGTQAEGNGKGVWESPLQPALPVCAWLMRRKDDC